MTRSSARTRSSIRNPRRTGWWVRIRRLGGSAEQAVYIGDSAYDMQCAAAAGVKSGLALWGSETPDALQADMRLTHPSELLLL